MAKCQGLIRILTYKEINAYPTTSGTCTDFLYPHLRKHPCSALVEGTLKVEDECYLPDVMVTCNEQDLTENKTYIEHPKLVIEVLSPGTEKDDRMDKVWVYTVYLLFELG